MTSTLLRRLATGLATGLAGTLMAGTALAQNLSIATGGTGGVYYPMGGGMAAVLSKFVPGMQATAEVTGGSVDNLKLVGSGKPYIGLSMADAAQDALKGEGKFSGNKVGVRTLMVLYPNRMHVVSVEGRGVAKMADLKGKRVSTGSPGSATEIMASRAIEATGLNKDKDMRRQRLGVAESVNALTDHRIDAFFWVGGIPTAAISRLAIARGIKMKLIDHADVVDRMNEKYGKLYSKSRIKAGTYPGYRTDCDVAEVWNLIVTGDRMSDEEAYTITKTLIERKDDIAKVHKEAESFSLDNQMQDRSPVPFHPGALKYFKENGVGD